MQVQLHMTTQFEDQPWAAVCFQYSAITNGEVFPDFLPDIIVWDAQVQFLPLSEMIQHCPTENCEKNLVKKG